VRPVIALSGLLFASCAQPPTKELEMAATRVESARDLDAAVLAPEPFAEAESALREARRSADGRDYRSAIRAAAVASVRADEAMSVARAERLLIARRLDQLLFEIEGLLEMAAEAEEIAPLRARYESVNRLADANRILDAYSEATALKPELLELERSLRESSSRTSAAKDPSR
jgi:hypothetical protein